MAMLRKLSETLRSERRPRAVEQGPVLDYRAQIVQHLRSQALTRHALLFSEPNVLPDRVQWFTDLPGDITKLNDLPPAPRQEATATLLGLLDDLHKEADRLRGERAASMKLLGDALAAALMGPQPEDAFLVGGQPVLAGWGLIASEGERPLADLVGTLQPVRTVPRVRPPPPGVQVPAGADTPPPPPPPVVPPPFEPRDPIRWPLRLLALAAFLLLLASIVLWFLPEGARAAILALRLPPAPVCDPGDDPSRDLLPLEQEELQLRMRLAELERLVADRIVQCRIADVQRQRQPPPQQQPPRQEQAGPATVPPPVTQPDIDRRLQRQNGRNTPTQVTLAWNGPADLDLYVACPSGEVIRFNNKMACGGEHDVDANGSNGPKTDTPVENVVWPNGAPPGRYRVLVHYYDYNARRTPVPYTLRITINGQQQTLSRVADQPNLQQVTEFVIP